MDRLLEMQSFASVIDAGSFVGAADALGLSKAAVSRHVNALESRLGVRLLHRTTRRLSLTAEGELFLSRCRELLAGLEEAEAEVTASSAVASGLLRINVPVSFGLRRLAPLWGEFRRLHPQIRLDITLADRVVDLVEEGFDLAVRIGVLENSSLVARRLAESRLLVCAAPAYLAEHGAPAHPAELRDHSVIAYSYHSGGDEWRLQGPQGGVSVRVNPAIQSNNGDTCVAAALAGQGLVMQPDFLVDDAIARGELVTVMPDYVAGTLGVYAVYPSRRHVALKTRVLIDFLRSRLGQSAAAQ
ncbi:LysR family transcriptional regulator [Seongchinamella sediminis]|uniref:LysR family transcriptional regulator n=1 Tax=Seongchinamella sediminis TaxID=2283635 RepID=A0A3L7E4F5_9GAMM|nr:LysR family transcriptional regulator [Seongchinamella sediminis]RLQ23322.1 LysR family transcriptional regulator [Seongchinamella sediminis]